MESHITNFIAMAIIESLRKQDGIDGKSHEDELNKELFYTDKVNTDNKFIF